MKNAADKKVFPELEHTLSVDGRVRGLSEADKISAITYHFERIMEALGLDLGDDSLKDTPSRVAKMYVKEIFRGLDPAAFPAISLFKNTYGYGEMLLERDIKVYSCCEHHFVPFIGRAHVAYIPGEMVIGLSKLNRIVDYFARRPQVQERLTTDIARCLQKILGTEDVAVVIEATHYCVASRGVEDTNSATLTSQFGGRFNPPQGRAAFYEALRQRTI